MSTSIPENVNETSVVDTRTPFFAGTDVPKDVPFVTPLEAARGIVAEQYLAAQDREDQGRTSLKAAEDHHATCVDELNLLEDAHRALFPEAPTPDPTPTPAGAAPALRR